MELTLEGTAVLSDRAARGTERPIGTLAEKAKLLERSLDLIDCVLLCIDGEHRVHWANLAARLELQDARHPLQLQAGRLGVRHPVDDDLLRRAVRDAASKGRCRLVVLDHGQQALSIAVMPLEARGEPGDVSPNTALLAFGRRQPCSPIASQWFAHGNGLTCAETRVLQALNIGLCPREIAERQAVALSTVRTHVRSLRNKTGAQSIGDLLRKVATLPPVRSR